MIVALRIIVRSTGVWLDGLVGARVVGPQKVAGTLHSETPLALVGGKGAIREISMRGLEATAWFSKALTPSPSVVDRRLEGQPIFAKSACGAPKVQIFSVKTP